MITPAGIVGIRMRREATRFATENRGDQIARQPHATPHPGRPLSAFRTCGHGETVSLSRFAISGGRPAAMLRTPRCFESRPSGRPRHNSPELPAGYRPGSEPKRRRCGSAARPDLLAFEDEHVVTARVLNHQIPDRTTGKLLNGETLFDPFFSGRCRSGSGPDRKPDRRSGARR